MTDTQLRRPSTTPLYRWPWAYVVLANVVATVVLAILNATGRL